MQALIKSPKIGIWVAPGKIRCKMLYSAAKAILDANGAASRLHLSGAIRKASAHLEAMDEDKLISNHQAIQSVSPAANNVHAWTKNQEEEKLRIQNFNLTLLSMNPAQVAALSVSPLGL